MSSPSAASSSSSSSVLQTEETLFELLTKVLFPPIHFDYTNNIVYAFGYGSGVLSQLQSPQLGNSSSSSNNNKMIDIIVVVNNVQQFHYKNLQYNPHHYNNKYFTASATTHVVDVNDHDNQQQQQTRQQAQHIAWIQCHTVPLLIQRFVSNPGVYFHLVDPNDDRRSNTTTVDSGTGGIKYGIIQADQLRHDLQHWSHLYIAGRMHKPIIPIPIHRLSLRSGNNSSTSTANGASSSRRQSVVPSSTTLSPTDWQDAIRTAQQQSNLPAAFATAVLNQWYTNQQQRQQQQQHNIGTSSSAASSSVSLQTIYEQIVNLSYRGDPRMGMFEDPNKSQNIVSSQYHHFHTLYQPIIQSFVQDGFVQVVSNHHDLDFVDTASPLSSSSSTQQHQLAGKKWSLSYNWDHPLAHDRLWQCIPYNIRQQCRLRQNNEKQPDEPESEAVEPVAMRTSNDNPTAVTTSRNMAAIRRLQTILSQRIVAPAARYQSIKGLYSTGIQKSVLYLYRKFTKGKFGVSTGR